MQTIVTFGNCQGQHLAYMLGAYLPPNAYEIIGFSNNGRTGGLKKSEEIIAAVKRSDFFIYQPLNEKHGPLCTSRLVQQLKPGAKSASFPYFYNSGAYSLCHAPQTGNRVNGTIFGEEIIVSLLEAGLPIEEILARYRDGLIDFRLAERFAESHAQMRLRQEGCEIRVTGFIKKYLRQQKLFLTHNHPTNIVFFEMLRQMASLTGLPIAVPAPDDEELSQLAKTNCPVSPYDIKTMGYPFEPDPDWYERGSELILKVNAEWRQGASR